jgi:hypothetical protein
VQTHANRQVNKLKLDIPDFQDYLQPKEFMVTEKIETIDQKKVLREAVEIRSQSNVEEEDALLRKIAW